MLVKIWNCQGGVSAVEYAFVAALIAVGIIVSLQLMGIEISETFGAVQTAFGE